MNIKIVTLSKNEGWNLPSFIFHHLFFGFNSIDIFINRTTDNSIDIIKKINKIYTNVNYHSCDWIDKIDNIISDSIQKIIYAYAFDFYKNSCDYIFFIDIDEFCTPINFKTGISQLITDLGYPDSIYFQWLLCGFRKYYTYYPIFTEKK